LSEKVIVTRNLSKTYYSKGRAIHAVQDLNLVVDEGEIFGLLGPNGAGKTTTIHMLLGLTTITGGEAHVLGYDVKRQSREIRRYTGLIPERAGFYWDLSAFQNLKYFAELSDIPRNVLLKRIDWALEFVGLSKWRNMPVKTFSRGMVQRLVLAQVLVKQPKIIFMDEPTTGLDPRASRMFRELIKRINREFKVTILVSSHLLHEVKRICSRVGFMNRGRLVKIGNVDDLLKSIKLKILAEFDSLDENLVSEIESLRGVEVLGVRGNAVLLAANDDVRLEISRIAFNYGRMIRTLKLIKPTLEELFLSLTGGVS